MTVPALIVLILLGGAALYCVFMGTIVFFMMYGVFHPRGALRRTYAEARQWVCENTKADYYGWYDKAAAKESFTVSSGGVSIAAEYIPPPKLPAAQRPVRCLIRAHGFTQNRMLSAPYAKMFHEAGYAVVIYDQRAFGQSGGRVCSMGERERYDLLEIIKWVRAKLGDEVYIGLHGESMGAITVLEAAALIYGASTEGPGAGPGKIGFVIADSAPSDLTEFIGISIPALYRLPRQPAFFFAKIFAPLMGVPIARVSPRSHLGRVETPLLFIHGEEDRTVPVRASRELFAAAKDRPRPGLIRRLEIFPGADHCWCILNDPERYRQIITDFVKDAGGLS